MRIGIFFGGKSREREISFAGGRTIYDLLDKSVFTPVPLFVDSLGNIIELDWQYLYKGSIRDFYPPVSVLKTTSLPFQVYMENLDLNDSVIDEAISKVGTKRKIEELPQLIDFAFLALHGPYGEDGTLQGMLEFYNIPFSGSGILPSAIGIDKYIQKELMQNMGVTVARALNINRKEWTENKNNFRESFFEKVKNEFRLPVVIKSATQGSSIGVSIFREWNFEAFTEIINNSFFIRTIYSKRWKSLNSTEEKRQFVQQLCDIYEGTGAPFLTDSGELLHHPQQVFDLLENHFNNSEKPIKLQSLYTERSVLVEEFIEGKEFSCIVVEGENGEAIALPPTEIIKSGSIFDYRSKYLPGISRKITPIELPEKTVENIARACENLYDKLHFNVYARIDGIIRNGNEIFLNDPNTTSGMLPSSFFFHQAAEIGVSPSQFLTYIIYRSLEDRIAATHFPLKQQKVLLNLENELNNSRKDSHKMRVAVVLGGISTERHISVESGRNVFEKLSSSGKYEAIPVFLSQNGDEIELYKLPLNLLLKDNADDIREKAQHYKISPIVEKIIDKAQYITKKFASADYNFYPQKVSLDELANEVDSFFIALHGRPGEDGTLQKMLEARGIPYNGSGSDSSSVTINKYVTNEILRGNSFLIPEHVLVTRENWVNQQEKVLAEIESKLKYPCIAKPADDGCSSAVKKVKNKDEFIAFAEGMFRNTTQLSDELLQKLDLKASEEFPCKDFFVAEELVDAKGAKHFLEVTGGMLTRRTANGEIEYEVFEASEALAQKGILSLEEKFLAGEGQNITPARYSNNAAENSTVSKKVRETLEAAAKVLNIEGYCRIDAFVRIFDAQHVEVIFIEVNSLPGLTPATCIFHQAALNGYKPFDFLNKIIEYGKDKVKYSERISAN